jgi:hypothetical protein
VSPALITKASRPGASINATPAERILAVRDLARIKRETERFVAAGADSRDRAISIQDRCRTRSLWNLPRADPSRSALVVDPRVGLGCAFEVWFP